MENIKKRLILARQILLAHKRQILLVFLILFMLSLVISLIISLNNLKRPPITVLPSPTPTSIASPVPIRTPSSIATESGFLKLENDLNLFEKDLSVVDLSEPKLSFPTLEMNVSFEK